MNTAPNALHQVRRDMQHHVAAMSRPSSELVRRERRALVSEMARQVARMEAALATTQARRQAGA
jgi:hypothetical protein